MRVVGAERDACGKSIGAAARRPPSPRDAGRARCRRRSDHARRGRPCAAARCRRRRSARRRRAATRPARAARPAPAAVACAPSPAGAAAAGDRLDRAVGVDPAHAVVAACRRRTRSPSASTATSRGGAQPWRRCAAAVAAEAGRAVAGQRRDHAVGADPADRVVGAVDDVDRAVGRRPRRRSARQSCGRRRGPAVAEPARRCRRSS